MTGLLDGVRVIESASMASGGGVGMLLADLGADVIKVENPHGGDLIRYFGQLAPGFSPAFLQLHRNKRGVTADLRSDDGRAFFAALLASADVLIDGNAIGTLAKCGFGRERIAELNPNLILCEVNGFGSTGPYASIPVHGLMMQALIGDPPVEVPGAPKPKPSADGALAAANSAAMHIAAALYRRSVTGQGAVIDVSGADALLLAELVLASYELNQDRLADPSAIDQMLGGYLGPRYRLYDAADGQIAFTVMEPAIWQRFCAAVDRPDLVATQAADDELTAQLAAVFAARTVAEWVDIARQHRISIGPVHTSMAEVAADPHIEARGVLIASEHPVAGTFVGVGTPAIVDDERFEITRPAPALGEHNEELRAELHALEHR